MLVKIYIDRRSLASFYNCTNPAKLTGNVDCNHLLLAQEISTINISSQGRVRREVGLQGIFVYQLRARH